MTPNFSIIVPARDEQRYIARALTSVVELTSSLSCELVVVDNGSVDDTREIARRHGARVLELPDASIAAVRNFGVHHSSGETVVFLDADMVVTASWSDALPGILERLRENPLQVLGARVHAPEEGLLNRFWFNRLREYSASYINSGNLLTSRSLFETLDGFDETLTTAEDYDFCSRAREAGASIIEIESLETLHLGYPDSASGFIRRERWHGRQDFATLGSLRESKVAWVALANLFAFAFCTGMALLTFEPVWILAYTILLGLLCGGLTVKRFGIGAPLPFLVTSGVFALYVWGRSLAGIDRVLKSSMKRPCSPR